MLDYLFNSIIYYAGNFGCVYRGLLQQGEEKQEMTVAVKTLKSLTGKHSPNHEREHRHIVLQASA